MHKDLQRPFRLPDGAVEVILVRHGSSTAGEADAGPPLLVGGHHDPPLAPEGHRQAERVARRLAPETPAAIFITPLKRTAQTAAPMARRLGLEPIVVPELREVQLGDWEIEFARRVARRDPLVRRMLAEERWDVIPGAEPAAIFAARVAAGLSSVIAATAPGTAAVVVTHAGVIAELCHQVAGSRPFAFLTAENAGLTRIVVTQHGRLQMRGFNDVSHLAVPSPGLTALR